MSWSYVYIFFQSSCLEIVIYYLFYRGHVPFKKVFIVTTAANAITHPIVFFGFMRSPLSYLIAILAAETFAVIGETWLHAYATKLPLQKTLLAAAFANLFSWQLAPVLTYILVF